MLNHIFKKTMLIFLAQETLCEICPNTKFFLGRMRENTDHKKLCIWTFSMQWKLIVLQKDFIEIVMNKAMVEVYIELLRDVFQNLEGAENFIKQRIEEICEWKKISVDEVLHFYIFFCFFLVLWQDVNLPFSLKIVMKIIAMKVRVFRYIITRVGNTSQK